MAEQDFRFQIRSGTTRDGVAPNGSLLKYELGWGTDGDNGGLFIGLDGATPTLIVPKNLISTIDKIINGTTTVGKATSASSATTATNVSTNINGKSISSIFESNGTTVKNATTATSATSATKATKDGEDNVIASTYLTITNAGSTYLKLSGGTLTNTLTLPRIRLSATDDCSLTSTDHAIQVGATSGQNLIIDGNEIISRNNSAASTLYLNESGKVEFGDVTKDIHFDSGAYNITHTYNSTAYNILKMPNSANISLNAQSGNVYIGYETTTNISLGPKGSNSTAPSLYIGPGIYETTGTDAAKLYFKKS